MDDRLVSLRKVLSVPRSLAFYAVFYIGSVMFVTGSLLTMYVHKPSFRMFVRGWCGWHRLCCRVLLGIRVELENPVFKPGVLYAIRHESFFEAIDMPWLFRLPVVFAKAELLRIPGWGPAARNFGLIGVEREAGAKALRTMLSEARRLIAEDRPLIIFPEGTRTPHGTPGQLQAGFAGIYKLLRLPVIPVAVDSGPLYQRTWKRPGTIRYRFAEEIPAGLPREEIEARVEAAINALNGNALNG
ncbi:MAG: 1-acyl-sn-glycerol-3-phosphate acyltransferase [Novosphingobium sp. 17-62-19]|uniref:lysophospholipid acyltransferase family protein n=1 Tax=Novosphingobium sp. 17-62-19 TaxID=1970406 RepID=UPI000BD312E3|nr:lysophospholipid acyltransferase family protein [Novosphingobium sp. 17-62-19]OZA21223.1 MAG: 1-acyl-sn-glycerol-3-phosphate acyltransferase [Novosphingobium sp. 17-62-19]HQS95173.1 lysophospholipid acyltransferase family protein [Novosphingobium sp.]